MTLDVRSCSIADAGAGIGWRSRWVPLVVERAEIGIGQFFPPTVSTQPFPGVSQVPGFFLTRLAEGDAGGIRVIIGAARSSRVVHVVASDLDREGPGVHRKALDSVSERGVHHEGIKTIERRICTRYRTHPR